MKKRHYIARSLTALIGIGLIGYAIRLFLQQAIIVLPEYASYNIVGLIFVVLFALYLVVLVLRPTLVPNNRRGLSLLGVIVVLVAHYGFKDNAAAYVFTRDILTLVGVLFVITGPMKLLLTKEAEQKKYMEEVEIIEV